MMPNHITIKVRIVYLFSGNALSKLGKIEEAITMFDRALKINPNSVESYASKGKSFMFIFRKCTK